MTRPFTRTHLMLGADDHERPDAYRNGLGQVVVNLGPRDHEVVVSGDPEHVIAFLMAAAARVFEVAEATKAAS
jgi:hypothetical protein